MSPLQLDIEAEMEAIHQNYTARNQPPQQRSVHHLLWIRVLGISLHNGGHPPKLRRQEPAHPTEVSPPFMLLGFGYDFQCTLCFGSVVDTLCQAVSYEMTGGVQSSFIGLGSATRGGGGAATSLLPFIGPQTLLAYMASLKCYFLHLSHT